MGKVKYMTDQVECHYCGQLSFVDDLVDVPIADGPDDFVNVGMCKQCANDYEEHCLRDAGIGCDVDDEREE